MKALIVLTVVWAVFFIWLGERLDRRFKDSFVSALLVVGLALPSYLFVLWVAS